MKAYIQVLKLENIMFPKKSIKAVHLCTMVEIPSVMTYNCQLKYPYLYVFLCVSKVYIFHGKYTKVFVRHR